MRCTFRSAAVALAAAALLAAPSSALAGKKKLEFEAPLVPTASGPLGASGEIDLSLRGARVDLSIEVEDLPLGAYDLVIGGVSRGSIVVDATPDGAEGEIEFRNRPRAGKVFLDFDPAGMVVEIQQGGAALLSGVVPDAAIDDPAAGALRRNFPRQNVRLEMTSTGADADADATMRFRSNKKGAELELRFKDMPAGDFDVFVDDALVATIALDGKRREAARFSTRVRGKRLPLDFDPAGAVIRIAQGGVDFFTTTLSADPLPGMFAAGELKVKLAPTGVQPGAEGEAKLRSRMGRDDFSVEIEDVEAGVYDLLVDGVSVGSIVAAPTSEGVEGEVEFRSLPNDDPDKLDLTFDPRGKLIQVAKDGAVILGGMLPTAPPTP